MGHPVQEQWDAWKVEAKRGHYIRPELPGEEEFLRNPVHCGKDPVWVHLPREPDYSKHKDKYEPEQEGEEEEMQSVEEEEIQSLESSEEEESAQVSAEEGESEVEVEVEETSGDERKSGVSAPFPLHDPGHQFLDGNTSQQPKWKNHEESPTSPTKEEGSVGKYIPPHRRRPTGSGSHSVGGASSSKPAPEPYKVSNASRAIVLGELLSKRVDELDKLRSCLDDLGEDESREDLLNSIAVLELEINGLKEEQKSFRRKMRPGYSPRQEADKKVMGNRLAYLKEKSRKRAAAKRLGGQRPRTEERQTNELEWHRWFDRPGGQSESPCVSVGDRRSKG